MHIYSQVGGPHPSKLRWLAGDGDDDGCGGGGDGGGFW